MQGRWQLLEEAVMDEGARRRYRETLREGKMDWWVTQGKAPPACRPHGEEGRGQSALPESISWSQLALSWATMDPDSHGHQGLTMQEGRLSSASTACFKAGAGEVCQSDWGGNQDTWVLVPGSSQQQGLVVRARRSRAEMQDTGV